MTQSSRNQPSKQTNLANVVLQGGTVVLHSKLEHLWRINGEEASLLLPGLLVLSFYFKIGETRSPESNDKKNSLQGRNTSVHVTVCVNNIDLFVTLSRCHAMQFTTTTN